MSDDEVKQDDLGDGYQSDDVNTEDDDLDLSFLDDTATDVEE